MLESFEREIMRCLRCGYCYKEGICPIADHHPKGNWLAFSPQGKLILARGLLTDKITMTSELARVFYYCTQCLNCDEQCTLNQGCKIGIIEEPILHHFKLYNKVRAEIYQNYPKMLPDGLTLIIDSFQRFKNPYGLTPEKRVDWAAKQNITLPDKKEADIILFTGCTAATKEENHQELCASALILDNAKENWAASGFCLP